MGLASAPHKRSATIVADLKSSCSVGSVSRSNQVNKSGSAICSMILPIFFKSRSNFGCAIWGGSLPDFSMVLTRFLETPARPISRSLANGGHVDILNADNTEGFFLSGSTPTLVRFRVTTSISSTSFVVRSRVCLNAAGAERMNQSLYMSIEAAMSCFHCSGLLLLTAIASFFA